MLSPSDYNNAVPQFTNGNYANTPLNPLYVEEPDAVNYNRGSEPIQTLPAQWWNWLMNQITAKLNKLNIYVKNIFDELAQLLSLVSVTPDGTESTITTGQLKDMFQTKYPAYLDNFKFESLLQGRTRGVMFPPTDSWDNDTNTLTLTGGFGVIDSYKKVNFATTSLVLPNDSTIHYIISDADGIITIQDSAPTAGQILIGLCHDKEYCLLADNDVKQCKENIILEKWFGQNKITQGFVTALQSYYNTTIASIETKISITTVSSGNGIDGGTYNNCAISIGTVDGIGNHGIDDGVDGSTFNYCTITISTVPRGFGIVGSNFYNCTISIVTVGTGDYSSNGFGAGNRCENCTININTVNGNSRGISNTAGVFNNCIVRFETVNRYGIEYGSFNFCLITVTTTSSSNAIQNASTVSLRFTSVSCSAVQNLNSTSGKLNILNNTVLHTS